MALLTSFTGEGQSSSEVQQDVDSGIDALANSIFPAYDELYHPKATGNSVWPAASSAIIQRSIARRDLTVTGLKIFVAIASGNVDVGIYVPAGVDFARLASSGSVAAVGTAAIQAIPFSGGPIVIPRGTVFYYAMNADNGTLSLGRVVNASSTFGIVDGTAGAKAGTFPLPATITDPLGSVLYFPWMRTYE